MFASVPDVSEAQSNVHALALFLLGSLGYLTLRRLPVGLMGALVRNIMPERRAELLSAICEELRVVCPARNGNVSDAVVEQVFGPQLGIDVDQHTVGGLSLAGMTCDRAAMIEARMRRRIKLDCTVFWTASVQLKLIRPSWPIPSTVPSSRLASFKSGDGAHSLEATEQGRALGRGS